MINSSRTKNGYGNFGTLSKDYALARKGFPVEALSYIFQRIKKERPSILDIGCGTGIATEQLQKRGAHVVGTDIDPVMIQQAQARNSDVIKFYIAPASQQLFKNSVFDAVTAFSAFHWFTDQETMKEIKRVLELHGVFFAINKNEIGTFKKQNKAILQEFLEKELPDAKKSYNPAEILEKYGLHDIEEKSFKVVERFSPSEATRYIQTMSIWNLVPIHYRQEVLQRFKHHFNSIAENGVVRRELAVRVVSGRK